MNRKLILFNGPRHSGKDAASLHVASAWNAYHFKFSAPIKAAIKAAFDLSNEEVLYLETIKTTPTPILLGKSYVEVQISFSENWAKLLFGQDVFGQIAECKLTRAMNETDTQLFVCSDSGFAVEAWPIINTIFGKENTLLVRISREGKDFTGDSRSYIDLPGVDTIQIKNNGTLPNYYGAIDDLINFWLQFKSDNYQTTKETTAVVEKDLTVNYDPDDYQLPSGCPDGFCPLPGVRQGPSEGMFTPICDN
jgi:hypothetical protein